MATIEPPPLTNGNSNGIHSPALDGPSAADGAPSTSAATAAAAVPFDAGALRTYLASLLPVLLGAAPAELEGLFDEAFDERAARFAAEGGGPLYVVKVKDDVEGMYCTTLKR